MDIAPSAKVDKNQSPAQMKRPLEAESSSPELNSDRQTARKSKKPERKSKKAKFLDSSEEIPIDQSAEPKAPKPPTKPNTPPFFYHPQPSWHVLLSQIRNLVPLFT